MTIADTASGTDGPSNPGGTKLTREQLVEFLGRHFYAREILQANRAAFSQALPANNQILIAAMPKSGSTLLVRALAGITGRAHNLCAYTDVGTEQDLYFPVLVRDTLMRRCVCKLHLRATPVNIELMRAFNITPIVQVRNVLDVIVSARDHVMRDVAAGAADPALADHLNGLDEAGQYDYVIDTQLPTYLAFYASWRKAAQGGEVTVHWVDYDALNADAADTIAGVLRFLAIEPEAAKIRQVLDELGGEETRFNRGVVGRGRELLSAAQRRRVAEVARHYPAIDKAALGIDG